MTAQINDTVGYRGADYQLTGIKGQGLFEPSQHGIFVAPMHTACWRGYIARYAVVDDELQLDSVEMQLAPVRVDAPTTLFGKEPTELNERRHATFKGLASRIPFTGGLLLARDFIQEMYVHMGFHPAYKYRVVHELVFDEGRLSSASDQSAIMAQIRDKLAGKPLGPGGTTDQAALMEWIKSTFSRDYW